MQRSPMGCAAAYISRVFALSAGATKARTSAFEGIICREEVQWCGVLGHFDTATSTLSLIRLDITYMRAARHQVSL